jgi:putative tryptophan/tyrosine transport system substrate-binding protein
VSAVWARIRRLILTITAGIALSQAFAWADQPSIPRIGVLTTEVTLSSPARKRTTVFPEDYLSDGLRDLGYIEGKTIHIEWRRVLGTSAETSDELRSLVADLTRSKVDLIVVFSTPAARAALQDTAVPVVFVAGDPVGTGLAASLARPGGRGTGVSMLMPEITSKRIELLRQAAPGIHRIVFLMNSSNPLNTRMLEEAQRTARTLGMELATLDARNTDELDSALHAMRRGAADGLLVSPDLFFLANRVKVTQAVRKAKLPAIYPYKEYHDDGALMSYGADVREANRKAAAYVDKILKGAKPSELPIEQMSKYDLVIDLRAARAIGIHVPQDLLLRADEVIR